MIEIFSEIYKIVGSGNLLTIVIALLSIVFAYYLYFRNFYRLVFSQSTICRNYENIEDWHNDETEFETRVILYNNGRKTLSKEHIQNLEILANTEIISCEQIFTDENITLKLNLKTVKINFENLDSENYILLKLKHKGRISISGRISESGKILSTETKNWVKINFIALIVIPVIILTPFLFVLENILYFIPNLIISIILIKLILYCLRYVHKMFFIPDELTEVFLKTKNSNNIEFKTELK